MITLETLRAAALAELPWTKFDEIVRAEMAAGRTTKQIAGEFVGIADQFWDTPGLPEDGSDAFGDTLDALTGNCHSDYRYKDISDDGTSTNESLTTPRSAAAHVQGRVDADVRESAGGSAP